MNAERVPMRYLDTHWSCTPGDPLTRRLLSCGVIAGPLFISVFAVEGARRPNYDSWRHPVSSLSLGPHGWVQRANFMLAGTLYLAGTLGLARTDDPAVGSRTVPPLLGAAGLGLLGSAVFNTDPVGGYPPGTPDVLTNPSTSMRWHGYAALPIFFGLPVAALVQAWNGRRNGTRHWTGYSTGTAIVAVASMALAGAGFEQNPRLAKCAGLFQRVAIVTLLAWSTTLLARAHQRCASDSPDTPVTRSPGYPAPVAAQTPHPSTM